MNIVLVGTGIGRWSWTGGVFSVEVWALRHGQMHVWMAFKSGVLVAYGEEARATAIVDKAQKALVQQGMEKPDDQPRDFG